MAALGWLLNLDFAGGVAAAAPDQPGIEFTMPENRMHHTHTGGPMHHTLPENRMHHTMNEEG